MNDNITLEQVIQQNCINLLSHKDFGYKFISKEDNLIFRENKTSVVLLKKVLIERLMPSIVMNTKDKTINLVLIIYLKQ